MNFNYEFHSDTPEITKKTFAEILNAKFDLEEIAAHSLKMETKLNTCIWQHNDNYSELSKTALWVRELRTSFISPAHCFNNYVDALVTDAFYDYFNKNEEHISMGLRSAQVTIELHNTLLSIKSGIDRLTSIISQFYKGINKNGTFGHKKTKEGGSVSYTGLLSFCSQMKEKDELFSYIHSEYDNWIAECVKPRDTIVHYKDFFNSYVWCNDIGVEMPISTNQNKDEDIIVYMELLKSYVDKYYNFMVSIIKHIWRIELSSLLKKRIIKVLQITVL